MRMYAVADRGLAVDLGRVDVLFYKGVPLAAIDWRTQAARTTADLTEGELVGLIHEFLGGMFERCATVDRATLEAFICTAYADQTP